MGRMTIFAIRATIFSIIIATFWFFLAEERANTRDALRLLDMRTIEQSFRQTFLATGSFHSATVPNVRDPGNFSYDFTTQTETSFTVRFFLERTHDGLRAGEHTLTESGIQ